MKVVLIDADSIIYSVCYKYKESNNLDDYIIGIDEWIHNIITTCEGTHYLGFLTIGKVFRHRIATIREYKAGRVLEKPKFFYEVRKHLIAKWKFVYFEDLEAEDLVAINATILKDLEIDYVIAKIDHDLDQIPGKHFDFKKNTFKWINDHEAKWNLWVQIIQGCSTDKITGIEGYGEAKAKDSLTTNGLHYKEELCRDTVLTLYIKKYGLQEGIFRFQETFNLCYLLRTIEEVEFVIKLSIEYKKDIEFPPIEYIPINTNNQDLTVF